MSSASSSRLVYPTAIRGNDVVSYHGVSVADPYRWLEDVDAKQTEQWVNEQVAVTNAYLANNCSDLIDKFKTRLTDVWNYPRFSGPFTHGNRWFQYRNSGLQNQSVLFMFERDPNSPAHVLLDPNTLSDDGTVAMMASAFSECGKYLAFAISKSGSDWRTIFIKHVDASLGSLDDQIEWVKFSSMAWTHDSKGFFYCRYAQPRSSGDALGTEVDEAKNQLVYYHSVGDPQSEDVLVFSDVANPNYMFGVEVSDCGSYCLLSISDSCDPMNKLYVAPLADFSPKSGRSSLTFLKLIDVMKSQYSYLTNQKSKLFLKTNYNADRYCIISIDMHGFVEGTDGVRLAKIVVPESDKDVLESVGVCGSGAGPGTPPLLFLKYLHDVTSRCVIVDLMGKKLHDLTLPSVGEISEINAHINCSDVYYKFTSFVSPGMVFHLDIKTMKTALWQEMIVPGLSSSMFKTEQIFYTSKDGTKIPMFIIRKQNSAPGPRPTVLYGYGGFNISLTPSFSVLKLVFIQHCDAVYAVANLRGGGEYGEQWHQSGTKQRKQNVFDDFHWAAKHLIDNGITKTPQLAISGGSNGGLLVAACLNQRPDLYGCAVAHVGVMDMLRFHKFTIGYAWTSDYGNAEENEEDMKTIVAYSPIHNVAKTDVAYPPVMLCTADHDDRVVPLHSFKLAAELQHRLGNRANQLAPLLIRIDKKAGHGAGKPLSKTIEEHADVFAFIARSLQAKFVS